MESVCGNVKPTAAKTNDAWRKEKKKFIGQISAVKDMMSRRVPTLLDLSQGQMRLWSNVVIDEHGSDGLDPT
jgi:hypothetical protein